MDTSPDSPPKNAELLSLAATVDEYAAHYLRAYPRLTAVAAGVLGRHEGAEDIVQEAAGLAAAKRQRFPDASAFVAWMAAVVRRYALNQRRKERRRRTHPTDPTTMDGVARSPSAQSLPVDPQSGELRADQDAFADELQRALQRLGDDARCCLLLRTVHDLSYAEIAELLRIPAGTAMSHVHRSRQFLRQALAAPLPPPTSDSPVSPGSPDDRV
jgi:RNA polymerase sigma-70 factor (ECF subfamily)